MFPNTQVNATARDRNTSGNTMAVRASLQALQRSRDPKGRQWNRPRVWLEPKPPVFSLAYSLPTAKVQLWEEGTDNLYNNKQWHPCLLPLKVPCP